MLITILNGNPKLDNIKFDKYLHSLSVLLKEKGHIITQFNLRDLNINHCVGCYHCWVETPGACKFKDDMARVLNEYIKSDIVIFASPIMMGFISAILKKTIDRLLPLFHIHLKIRKNLFYHALRYKKYPRIVLLLEKRNKDDDPFIEIINRVYQQMNLNYKFTKLTEDPIEVVSNEIDNI